MEHYQKPSSSRIFVQLHVKRCGKYKSKRKICVPSSFIMQIKCHFYDILLLCIRIENNQHLFSFVSYVPHPMTCNCTKIQPQPIIFMEFCSSLMCCTICACAKGRFSIKSAVLWFGPSQSLLIPDSNGLLLFDF